MTTTQAPPASLDAAAVDTAAIDTASEVPGTGRGVAPVVARPHVNLAQQLRDLPPHKLPRHIAIIMDGNGRWAVRRDLDRVHGHRAGADSVIEIVNAAADLRELYGAPDFITLYSFSVENWKRPATEVEALMQLYIDFLSSQRPTMLRRNVRYNQIGRHDELPDPVVEEMRRSIDATAANSGLTLTLAINYGGRTELTDAIRAVAQDVRDGKLEPHQVTEAVIESRLYTGGVPWGGSARLPDVDLLIRTAGEMRVSNYLLWQISYAELVVSQTLWPDFGTADFHAALREYASRNRRFGALDHTNTRSKR